MHLDDGEVGLVTQQTLGLDTEILKNVCGLTYIQEQRFEPILYQCDLSTKNVSWKYPDDTAENKILFNDPLYQQILYQTQNLKREVESAHEGINLLKELKVVFLRDAVGFWVLSIKRFEIEALISRPYYSHSKYHPSMMKGKRYLAGTRSEPHSARNS